MPAEIRDAAGTAVPEIRDIFLHPEVTNDYSVTFAPPDREGIIRFLCDEREFSKERVTGALERAFQ